MSENPYRQDNPFLSDESFQEKIKRLEADIDVLRAEVKAFREWQRTKCDDNASSLEHWHACKALDAATNATDAAKAMEER